MYVAKSCELCPGMTLCVETTLVRLHQWYIVKNRDRYLSDRINGLISLLCDVMRNSFVLAIGSANQYNAVEYHCYSFILH